MTAAILSSISRDVELDDEVASIIGESACLDLWRIDQRE
eukprot:CAMPEP_0114483628 /NCGR_PEP_ID=MMETSP0104-20121206/18976_1 /TAXON_ID=37642 ORGANISM="Paraphysomonas imperforata, Strain PA2" /NCGR_SAMPLE_ID=MMETSP0104 /ASSEMBLY_ACC=CAM_ASM_000202 /LENGTH=38 /DNA_ID= /DNA_START= /DNA_END= /DNA_ORIENTATION=